MSRMTASRASLSWTSAAIRRACSSGLKRFRVYPCSCLVKPFGPDDVRGRGRQLRADVLARHEPGAEIAGGDRRRLDLEEENALGPAEAPEHLLEPLAREARTSCDRDARQLEDVIGRLPGWEVDELVGADQEERVTPLGMGPERVDRA